MIKKLEEYVYRIKIHDIDVNTGEIILLFEEVDMNDGFTVRIKEEELRKLLDSGEFDNWAQERVTERINFLKGVKAVEEKKLQAKANLKDVMEQLEKKEVKPKVETEST